ncbi:uncharacterized protein LOC120531533 isoform X2 [Polypterus senegalus]|uniref:uncharacterized protein LOC120531533 isoform X2 n=1 Tax=Polypterus senegalus TaxID=55291 RepID=UPI001966C886|nr:uncharacterized protein LOC120531533 isoform X2 [Polypterus senegalus]
MDSKIQQSPQWGKHGFGEPWLDSCLEETLIPGKVWHKVYDKLGPAFAREVERQLKQPEHSHLIFSILGEHFVWKYFRESPHWPSPLSYSKLSDTERRSLEGATHALLEKLLEKAAAEVHCQIRIDGDYSGSSKEMEDFVRDTYNLVATQLMHLLTKEEAEQHDMESEWYAQAQIFSPRRRENSVDSKDLHLTTRRGSAYQLKPRGEGLHLADQKTPPLISTESEVLGASAATILAVHPELMTTVCERLKGKLLPTALRSSIWLDKLLKADEILNKPNSLQNLEKASREKFGRAVERRVGELKLRSATRSPISGLIENAVVEKYERMPCMQAFATNEQMIAEASKALNILYVHSGVYEPYLVLWLFPLQIAFKQTYVRAEHCYELAMYLHFLIHKFPSWPKILGLAEKVMKRVQEEDSDLYVHLQSCSMKQTESSSKDFLVELIAHEREQAFEMLDVPAKMDRQHIINSELLANPVIFLRKWMSEGFISALDLPAVLLIWDQFFMEDWNCQVMEDFSLAILMLLKDPLMATYDYQSLRQVFLDQPSHLFTEDIRKSWVHLQQGGLPADIPWFNQSNIRFLQGISSSPRQRDPVHPGPNVQVNVYNSNEELPNKQPGGALDVYIDAVQYIPDNATIIKVTGHFIQEGIDIPDILALPELHSPARSPQFLYRMTTMEEKKLDPKALLLLTVYTVDAESGGLSGIGSCFVHLFDEHGHLNVGGFQLRLRGGVQSKEITLTESSLSRYPVVPCCSLLIRILPHTLDIVQPPENQSAFYQMIEPKLNKSELDIISSFEKDSKFPTTVQDMLELLMKKEQASVPAAQWLNWYKERMDVTKLLSSQQYLSMSHMVHYRQQAGIRIRVAQAFGLAADGLYVNALARILKGDASQHLPELPGHWGGEEKFLSHRHDFASLLRSPRWTDPSVVLHPYFDMKTVLLVEFFGLKAVYKPDPSGNQHGKVMSRSGKELNFSAMSHLGWAAVPLFESSHVYTGVHHVPIFKNKPDAEILRAVVAHPLKEVIMTRLKKKTLKALKTFGSVAVELWDGHFLDNEHPDLPVNQELLKLNNLSKSLKAQSNHSGKGMSNLILQTLNKQFRKQGRNSPAYQLEERFYEESMGRTFHSLMEDHLISSGYGPI